MTLSYLFPQKGGNDLLSHYDGSHIKALQSLFPELNLKEENFSKPKKVSEGLMLTRLSEWMTELRNKRTTDAVILNSNKHVERKGCCSSRL
jgi:hypothetical protein